MTYFLVHIPHNQPDELPDHVDDVTAALAEHYRGPILGMQVETQDALNAGWCDACPTNCTQCSGDRSSCECYEHDTPEPTSAPLADTTPLHWRREGAGGLYAAAEADGGEWLLQREACRGLRGGTHHHWVVRRDHRIVATAAQLGQAKQWVQVERAGGHR